MGLNVYACSKFEFIEVPDIVCVYNYINARNHADSQVRNTRKMRTLNVIGLNDHQSVGRERRPSHIW